MCDNHNGEPFFVLVVLFLRHDIHSLVLHSQMLHIPVLSLCVQFVDIPIQTEESDKEQYSGGDQKVGRDGDVLHSELFYARIVTVSVPLHTTTLYEMGVELVSSLITVFASIGTREG